MLEKCEFDPTEPSSNIILPQFPAFKPDYTSNSSKKQSKHHLCTSLRNGKWFFVPE